MLVLLDRDGVINEDLAGGVRKREDFQLLPGAALALARLSRAGFRLAVVTNQSALARGALDPQELDAIHAVMADAVAQAGGRIDRIYVCGDPPGAESSRRKPAPGMLLEAMRDFAADAATTPMIGDDLRDLEAAAAAGCPRYLVKTGKGERLLATPLPEIVEPVTVCATLANAAEDILCRWKG